MTGKELKQIGSGETLELCGQKYDLSINFNVICDLEDHYGSFEKAGEALSNGKMKDVRFLLYAILHQDNDDLTERDVGKMITLQNMADVMDALGRAMTSAMPGNPATAATEQVSEEVTKNAESPQE